MKAILVSLWMFLVSAILYAQSGIYHPMPGSDAIWREYFGGYQVNCTDYQLSITGDTLVGDKVYQKLQRFGVYYYTDPMGNCIFPVPGSYLYYAGAYRNDSSDRKVYFLPPGQSTEELLYDFNLQLNDKLPETYGYRYGSDSDTAFVSLIDSVLIGSEYHQRYGISIGNLIEYVYLIEGIGSTYGLLSELIPPFEFGSNLLCFKQDSVTVFQNQGYDCVLVTGINDLLQDDSEFSISPNPIESGIGVITMPKLAYPAELSISDILGNKVLIIKNVEQGTILHTEHLNPGIFLFSILAGKEVLYSGKLVIGQQ